MCSVAFLARDGLYARYRLKVYEYPGMSLVKKCQKMIKKIKILKTVLGSFFGRLVGLSILIHHIIWADNIYLFGKGWEDLQGVVSEVTGALQEIGFFFWKPGAVGFYINVNKNHKEERKVRKNS